MTSEWLKEQEYEPIKPKTNKFAEEEKRAFIEKMNKREKL